ncbi:hypothetical protein JX266_008288 [Neoarthrinium moseri]|uniref:uncharacterized protein n=1 Tax=Neoarthrinium moseri TaxID=1658444 RepID=UPI001FDBDBCD|nr:uncharacterized protein JN550_006176 [Neoarthrinium moseri]KAI1845677.1 hypothetical protein JX266_008288 [Neoarthrinium moseri]KAI1868601.1 hypothetical protein JN550_006176 [Neoarthrinium moseri]
MSVFSQANASDPVALVSFGPGISELSQPKSFANFGPVALLTLVIGIVSVALWRRFLSPISNIPGPALASVTRFWHIRRILDGDQNSRLIALHDKHGHFVRIAPNEVSVSHPEAVKKILLAPLAKGDWYRILAIPDYRFQTPVSTTDPKEKLARSKNFAAGWTLSNILQNEAAFDDVIDLGRWITFTTFDTIGQAIFSKQFGFLKEGSDIGNSIANGAALNAYATILGFFRWVHVLFLGNPLMTSLQILPMGHLFNTSVQTVSERLENNDSSFDVLAHWLRALEKNPESMSMRDIYGEATGAIGAGSDTVTCATQSFLYHMLRHPNAWERVRNEIDEARRNGLCQDRVVSFADAQGLPFLQACIKEALRVFAPVPMTLPRRAPKEGLTIGGKYFPAGTTLSINPWVIHYSTELWGPDAREFNPDRWFRDDILEKEKYFIPFGAGYCSCPGQNFGKIEISKLTSTLVRDYNIRQVDPDQQWTWKAYFILVPRWTPCIVEKRSPL